MTDQLVHDATEAADRAELDHEVIVIGAGVAGIQLIKQLTDAGFDATVLEAHEGLGGTWFKNRYPGCRFDSESWTYGYRWSQEILDRWDWTEHFSPQPETLRYLDFVADTFDLRQHMQFNCRVQAMTYDDTDDTWTVRIDDGLALRSRFVVTAIGVLSVPTYPNIPGRDDFEGRSFHPFDWPDDLDLSGLRVGVIGTGATAIQLIPEVAKAAAHLTVFQRRPNWAAPLNNARISPEEMADIRSRYPEIFERCAETPGSFVHMPDRRPFHEVSPEERRAKWDELYDGPGFGIWLDNFVETFMDPEANAEISAYIADRIRGRVDDPELAEKLIPSDHGFGVQRLPLETGYYETYNRDNVDLVDCRETPIERVTATGIVTADGTERAFDVIVYATGFDAFAGAFDRIRIEGVGGHTLAEEWATDSATWMGLMVPGFPNLFMTPGPQSPANNFPWAIDTGIGFVLPLIERMRSEGLTRVEPTPEARDAWQTEIVFWYERMLSGRSQGWITGYNSNLAGHEKGTMRHNVYLGAAPRYVEQLTRVVERDYEGLTLT